MICGDLVNEYFSSSDIRTQQFGHEKARIKNEIALDYLNRIGDKVKEAKERFEGKAVSLAS